MTLFYPHCSPFCVGHTLDLWMTGSATDLRSFYCVTLRLGHVPWKFMKLVGLRPGDRHEGRDLLHQSLHIRLMTCGTRSSERRHEAGATRSSCIAGICHGSMWDMWSWFTFETYTNACKLFLCMGDSNFYRPLWNTDWSCSFLLYHHCWWIKPKL